MKGWEYQKRLTEILEKHAEQTRVPLEDEIVDGDETLSEKDPLTPAVSEDV